MIYLSQVLKKPLYYNNALHGQVVDFIISDNSKTSFISKYLVQKSNKRSLIPAKYISLKNNKFILRSINYKEGLYSEEDIFIKEDLLDKQVIDINNKRLVRVNDVVLENLDGLKVLGIDIGLAGIARRLGLSKFLRLKTTMIPWTFFETFDFNTGDIKIKLDQRSLSALRPAEIADILEEAGAKERQGIMQALGSDNAATAINETNNETLVAILEQTTKANLKTLVNKILISEIADIYYMLSPKKARQITRSLGEEKVSELKNILHFPDNVAAGLMDTNVYQIPSTKKIKDILFNLRKEKSLPETIIITNGNNKFLGTVFTKDLISADPKLEIKNLITDKNTVTEDTTFEQIQTLFAEYNIRLLPVINQKKQIVGVITIDAVLKKIEES